MKLKDAALGLVTFLGIMAFAFFIMTVDSLPMWFLLIVAAIAWAVYILMAFRDYRIEQNRIHRGTFWLAVDKSRGEKVLVALDGSNRTKPYDPNANYQTIYDQNAEKEVQ